MYKNLLDENISILSASRCFICAAVEFFAEEIALTAIVETWIAVHAEEITLTVTRLLVESIFTESKSVNFGILRALES